MNRTRKTTLAWLLGTLLIPCCAAWLLDCFALVVSSGGPHYTQAEWDRPAVQAGRQTLSLLERWFFVLPGLALTDGLTLWLLHRQLGRFRITD